VKHKVTLNPHKFRLALGLWAEDVGISRPHWSSLLEILRIYGLGPKFAEEVAKLPSSLSTLKQQTKAQLPLLKIRKKAIPLIPEETNKVSEPVSQSMTENLHFFDPKDLFRTLMLSDVRKKMHSGLAHWIDAPY
jgi:hypothetical protein